ARRCRCAPACSAWSRTPARSWACPRAASSTAPTARSCSSSARSARCATPWPPRLGRRRRNPMPRAWPARRSRRRHPRMRSAAPGRRPRRRARAPSRRHRAAAGRDGTDMQGPIDITPEALAEEALRVQRKLAAGLASLRQVGDIGFGATRREEVWRDGKVVLYRFVGERTPTARVPLLIAYALVNRPYMVDLQHDKSLVRQLLARGQDVYIIDWGYPDRSDRFLALEDYIERFLGGAVDHLRAAHGVDAVNLLGICQGGAFSLTYAALHPGRVRNLITMVTPVDFHTPDNMLSN